MTPEQKKALALAAARRRRAEAQGAAGETGSKATPQEVMPEAAATERGFWQALGDNVIGFDDGVDSWGERAGRQINDAGSAMGAGISRGVTGIADMPGLLMGGGGKLAASGLERIGVVSPEVATGMKDSFDALPMGSGGLFRGAASDATGGASEFRGNTTVGQFSGTVGEFLPGALIGSGSAIKNALSYGVVPGVASEAAGQLTEGTSAEPYARVLAALAASTGMSAINRPPAPRAPTADALKGQAEGLYRTGDARSAAPVADVQGLKGQIQSVLRRESIVTPTDRVLADGNVKKFLDVIDDFDGQQMTPRQMQSARQFLRDAAGSADPSDRRIGTILLDEFDGWRNARVPEYQQADAIYGRMKRAQDVDWRIEKADRRAASTGTGGNQVNAARQNIRQILDNPKSSRGYSEVEKALMEDIVRGTGATNALRLAGRLSPTSGALPLMGNIAGVGLNPVVGIAAMGASAGAKGVAEALTGRQISRLSETIRNGSQISRQPSDVKQAIIAALLGINADAESQ